MAGVEGRVACHSSPDPGGEAARPAEDQQLGSDTLSTFAGFYT